MKNRLLEIKDLIRKDEVNTAIMLLENYISRNPENDEAYYLLGNLYRKQGNWQMALNNYSEAIERNPDGPAVQAYSMLMDILNFYNKDMYNQ
ncbi:tetratricopeptide repeat protein [Phocaeicola abscessus]|uniref:tetratricopeptide repeat protein n=1 Tax=Phocaeicola abscessus TaxID=555313 RepID=UPI0004B374CF|nr:tetratricopeptide repeat protein [Phocaeicola abscessus]